MGRVATAWVVVAAAVLVVVGAAGAATIKLGMAASGSRQALHPGDTLAVSLAANLSTGYSWTVDARPAALRLAGRTYTLKPGTAIGRGGTSVLTFRADRAGTGTLALGYRRIWEKGKAPLRTFRVTVVVR